MWRADALSSITWDGIAMFLPRCVSRKGRRHKRDGYRHAGNGGRVQVEWCDDT
ncbi:MAG: hypothetical protein KDE45_04550 [Caldilineaceae bacterium]|nr:hypothetical protein [Caldilineaceae bacterium]